MPYHSLSCLRIAGQQRHRTRDSKLKKILLKNFGTFRTDGDAKFYQHAIVEAKKKYGNYHVMQSFTFSNFAYLSIPEERQVRVCNCNYSAEIKAVKRSAHQINRVVATDASGCLTLKFAYNRCILAAEQLPDST